MREVVEWVVQISASLVHIDMIPSLDPLHDDESFSAPSSVWQQ